MRADRDDDRGAGREPGSAETQPQRSARDDPWLGRHGVDQVGLADELGDEAGPGPLEEVLGAPHLDDAAPVQDGDTVGDDHRLRLVVGHVERGDGEGLVQPPDLEAHFLT